MDDREVALVDSEEEEEDDMMMLIIPSLYYISSRKKVPCHTSKLTGEQYVSELLEGHPSRCYDNFRMEPHIFKQLADYLRSRNILRNSRGVSVEEQLGIFMYMLSRNACYRALTDRFQHSPETIHRHLNSCFSMVQRLTYEFVKPPSADTHWKIRSNPHYWPYFENCLGALDGTHVPITIAETNATPYRNYKGTLTQNVLLACDFDLNFVYISTGWEGSASDAGVLQSAIQSGFHVSKGKYYLVDGGFANTPSFLAPYRGVRYHLKEQAQANCRPNDYKELFNLRHARLRNHAERAIGVLKMRFPILKTATFYPMETQVKIPVAAVALHNIIRSSNGDEEWLTDQANMIPPNTFVAMPNGDDQYKDDVVPMNNQRAMGNAMRDSIAKKMWQDYVESRRTRTRRRVN